MEKKNLSHMTDAQLEEYREELEEELMSVLWYIKARKKYKTRGKPANPDYQKND